MPKELPSHARPEEPLLWFNGLDSRSGGSVLLLRLLRPRAVHRMWWSETEEPLYLYEIRLDAPSGFSFQLQPTGR